jgi:hypothetical protein
MTPEQKKTNFKVASTVGGPSFREMLAPFSKSADQIAREQKQEHEKIVRKMRGGK